MASTAYDQSIRQSLNSKGINNGQIGYKNGYVTVDGQNFMKADKNYNGTAYTSAQNFNNAWNTYSAPKTTTTTTPSYTTPTYTTPSTSTNYTQPNQSKTWINDLQSKIVGNTQLPTNQYTSQVDDTIRYLMDFAKNQQSTDPYNTSEYKAYQAQSDRRAQQGIRASQEAMGSAGFGRSTALGERAQGIQNNETAYLETQVIPAILAAERERQQQQYSNVMNLLNPLMSQQSYADNRAQTELGNLYNALSAVTTEDQRGIDNTNTRAQLTGYLPGGEEAQQLVSQLLSLKQQAETKGITAADRTKLSNQADGIRAMLAQMGVDASQYGANVNYNTASQVTPTIRTLAGQQMDMSRQAQNFDQQFSQEQFEYQQARNAITDQQWKQQFDESVRQYGLNYGLNMLQENNQQAYRQAQLALSQDDNSRAWAALDWEMSNPTGATGGLTANQVLQSMKDLYTIPSFTTDEFGNQTKTGSKITTDTAQREQMFLNVVDAGLSDTETLQILSSLGMSKEEIEKLRNKNWGSSGN